MRFSTLFVSTVASASFALAQDDPPAEAVCTGSYPFALNTSSTNPELLTFWVSSSNPLTNGRPLQLREAEDGRTLAVVDATSPVAFGVLENGVLSVENGLTAATRNVTGNETNYVAEVYFENAEEGKQVIDWYLLGLSDPSGRANLYHKARFQTQNGFILCDKGDYWAFHYNAMAQGGPQHECDWIGVQVSTSGITSFF